MLRRLGFLLAMASLFMMASAQVVIDPVGDTGDADLNPSGTTEATVEQRVVLSLPQMTAIHLNAPEIVFDLTGENWAEGLTCVTSTGPDVPLAAAFHNQDQTVPGGIAYRSNGWNEIVLTYAGNGYSTTNMVDVPNTALATQYAPAEFDDDGRLIPGSKDYFVCYQTFIMQLFSNAGEDDGGWSLHVNRNDTGSQGIDHLYIQANSCAHFGDGTGLYALEHGESLNLLPTNMTGDTTGALATREGSSCDLNKSWLDILGVIAVKVNSDLAGDSVANLIYTLTSHFPQ